MYFVLKCYDTVKIACEDVNDTKTKTNTIENMTDNTMINTIKFDSMHGSWNCRVNVPCIKFHKNNTYERNTHYIQPEMDGVGPSVGKKTDVERVSEQNSALGSVVKVADDAVVGVASIHNPAELPKILTNSAGDGSEPSIKSFLAKPYAFAQGELSVADNPSTFVQWWTSTPLKTNPTFREKLRGVYSIRYTTVVTLQVNANRFQQGRYILAFIPTGGSFSGLADDRTIDWYMMHRATKREITQLHHVELDISTDTSVQLRIPYISAFPSRPLPIGDSLYGDPGFVFMYPYSPLAAPTGNINANFTVWVHYEDVEVMGNTLPIDATPVGPTSVKMARKLEPIESQMRNPGNTKRNVDVFEEEVAQTGHISSGLKLVSEGMDQMSNIPLLSGLTSKLAWVTRASSSVASSLGWSKPPVIDKISRYNRFTHGYVANEDQGDDCQPLSMFSDNHIEVAPGFASTDTDELSIDYLKSIFAWHQTVEWTTSGVAGDILNTERLCPQAYRGATDSRTNNTPVSFLAHLFEQYSGGFIFRIKLVKTEFHSGRLLVWFLPTELEDEILDPTIEQIGYLHRTIIDIREKNDFVIEMPYVSPMTWRNTTETSGSYGRWGISILDPLVAPETVAGTIEILIEVAGAGDLKFSVPKIFQARPCVPATMQSNIPMKSNVNDMSNPTLLESDTVGGTHAEDTAFAKDSYCVGERIDSLRSLLKRGSNIGWTNDASETTRNVVIPPFAWVYNQPTEVDSPSGVTTDIYTHLSSMYALQRGGVRVRVMTNEVGGIIGAFLRRQISFVGIFTKFFFITTNGLDLFIKAMVNRQVAVSMGNLGGIGVQVPYYHNLPSSASIDQGIATTRPYPTSHHKSNNKNLLELQFSVAQNLKYTPIYRSGADDCNFGAFVSTVPILALNM